MYKPLSIIALLLSLSILSCNNNSTEAESLPDSTALHIGVLPTIECLPLYYAQAEGLFDSLGLSITLDTYDAAMDADTAFASGYAHAIASDLVKMSILQMQGDSVSAVMPTDLRLYLMTARSARLTRVESIREKIIAITRHSALDYYADKLLAKYGMNSEEMNRPQINNLAIRTKMLNQNQYDGIIIQEPFAMDTETHGSRRIASSDDLNMHLGVIIAQDSIIRQHKAELDLLVRAYDMAIDALSTDSTNILRYLPQEHIHHVDDTLYVHQSFRHLPTPPDSVINDIKAWIKQRGNVIR